MRGGGQSALPQVFQRKLKRLDRAKDMHDRPEKRKAGVKLKLKLNRVEVLKCARVRTPLRVGGSLSLFFRFHSAMNNLHISLNYFNSLNYENLELNPSLLVLLIYST